MLAGCVSAPTSSPTPGETEAEVAAESESAETVEEPPAYEPNIPGRDSIFARDREAILSLAGGFRVDYRYEETEALRPGYETAEPFTSSAVEWVAVAQDTGERIVLQHLLVMGEPARVVKHWQQTWDYAPRSVVRYVDEDVWQRQALLSPGQVGRWSRTISDADGSPSYGAWGRWSHGPPAPGSVSTWSASTAVFAPPPRRDGLRRQTYQAILVRDRIEQVDDGWRQQQTLTKRWFADETPGLTRESGVVSYRRIDNRPEHADAFRQAVRYWRTHAPFWAEARRAWDDWLSTGDPIRLRDEVGGELRWRRAFDLAAAIGDAPPEPSRFGTTASGGDGTVGEAIRDRIDEALGDYIVDR